MIKSRALFSKCAFANYDELRKAAGSYAYSLQQQISAISQIIYYYKLDE